MSLIAALLLVIQLLHHFPVDAQSGGCDETAAGGAYTYGEGTISCYKIVSNDVKSWDGAQAFCKGNTPGGHLVYIRDAEDQAFLVRMLAEPDSNSKTQNIWVGARDIAGESTTGDGDFFWTDGESTQTPPFNGTNIEVTYTNW
jgi:hypothetical protein